MITIHLDLDESKSIQIKNINEYNSLDELLGECAQKFKVNPSEYGFKTKQQMILIQDVGDLVKGKKKDTNELFMQDKDYYDENLQTDTLIAVNLKKEAKATTKEISACTKELKDMKKEKKEKGKDKNHLGRMNKVSYNIRSCLDTFVMEFVNYDGIKEIMIFIEESENMNNQDLVNVAC